jgi:hypothetical protein
MACDQLPRDTPPTSAIRAAFLAFLGKPGVMDLIGGLTNITGKSWKAWDESPRFNFGAVLAGDHEDETPIAWARLLLPGGGAEGDSFGRDQQYADLVIHIEPGITQVGDVSSVGLAAWHQRFAQAIRFPAALARFLAGELGLATSSDPVPEMAIWLKARGASLIELVDVSGLKVIPGPQTNRFHGLAVADLNGQEGKNLARIWVAEMCDAMHLDGHESVLGSLEMLSSQSDIVG